MFRLKRREKGFLPRKERNLALNARESARELSHLESNPVSVYVDINLKCNLRCPSCHRNHPQHAGREWPLMPLDLFERVAAELFPTAWRVMLTGGGESLVHPDIDRILETCRRYQVYATIISNGTTVNRKRAALLAAAGVYMGISVDGATRETFEKLRYPARWDRFLKSLDLIVEARRNAANRAFFPHLQVVVQRDNIDELPGFVELAARHGFELVKFSNLFAHFPELEPLVPDPARAAASFVEAYERANESGIRLEAPDYGQTPVADRIAGLRERNVFPISLDSSPSMKYVTGGFVKYPDVQSLRCGVPWSEAMITPEGKVVVGCCSQYQMGDLSTQTFARIWNGEPYRLLRRTVNSGEPMEFCARRACPFRLLVPAS